MCPFPAEVTFNEVFVFVEVTGQDTVCRVIIDDSTLCRHNAVGEEKTRTEAVDIAYEDILCLFLSHAFIDTFPHAACCPVGEGETQHILRLDTISERQTDALGKDLRLATSRRSKDEMLPALEIKDFLL